MRIVVAAATLLLLDAGLAAAQVQPPQDRINTALERARQVGVPLSLLESKVAEGKAKGVPLQRIAVAVERREAALEHASQVLKGQGDTNDADLSVAADAIDSGVSDAVLKAVLETSPPNRRAVAIAALTQLVLLGHAPEAALARVQEALKRGPEALLNLPAEAGRRGAPNVSLPGGPGSRSHSGAAAGGPPESLPAPGGPLQPTKPGGTPPATGRPATGPSSGRGGA